MLLLNYILSPILSWFCWCSCNMVSLCSPDNLELWIVLPFLPGGQVAVCSAALGYFLWHAKHINREVFQHECAFWLKLYKKNLCKSPYSLETYFQVPQSPSVSLQDHTFPLLPEDNHKISQFYYPNPQTAWMHLYCMLRVSPQNIILFLFSLLVICKTDKLKKLAF